MRGCETLATQIGPFRVTLHPHHRRPAPAAEIAPQVPKHHSKYIPVPAASAANASGSLQTALSKVTRRSKFPQTSGLLRRVTFDRGLTFHNRQALFSRKVLR